MASTSLERIAEQVIRRAQRQGHVLPREVREELKQANLDERLWKDVLALARPALSYRQGRYYYTSPVSDRVRQEQIRQHGIQKAIRGLIRQHRLAKRNVERRVMDR